MTIQNLPLFYQQSLIHGQWTPAQSGRTFAVINPATSLKIADVADLGVDETKAAILVAQDAFQSWKQQVARERALLLMTWADLLTEHADEIATILTVEQGKPLVESKREVLSSANNIRWNAEESKRTFGDIIPTHRQDLRFMTLHAPVGVVGVITAWNFPLSLAARKVSAALAAGCTVVAKPSEETPLTMLAMGSLAKKAGLPDGVFNIVTTSDPKSVCAELMQNPIVRHVTFTGSTAVGKLLMQQAADTVKKLTLELGGNAPGIVFDDADLDMAIANLVAFKCSNAGQICTNVNRFLIQDTLMDACIDRIQREMDKIIVGHGLDTKTTMGPLINKKSMARLQALIDDAETKGAIVLRGGKAHALGHAFFEPTLITNATPAMRMASEELFGPVIALYRFKTEDEALTLANATRYGLASYLYTNDYHRIIRFSEHLAYGGVTVNTTDYSYEGVPFGGIKESGMGREGGVMGIREFLETKTICLYTQLPT